MGKKRIYELAKEINKSSKELVDTAQSLGFDVKNHMGAISDTEEKKLRQAVGVTKVLTMLQNLHPNQLTQMKQKNLSIKNLLPNGIIRNSKIGIIQTKNKATNKVKIKETNKGNRKIKQRTTVNKGL